MWMNSKINLDHDYATGIVNDRRKYTEAQRALKDLDLKFHSLYPARKESFYVDGPRVSGGSDVG